MRRHEVYISYAWGGESEIIVTEICQQLQNNKVKYYIDKKDIAYKDSIREFEERLGAGDYVILVVSDKFLKSKDCMYEFLQIKNAGNIYERIFPIVEYITPNVPLVSLTNVPDISLLNVPLFTGCN